MCCTTGTCADKPANMLPKRLHVLVAAALAAVASADKVIISQTRPAGGSLVVSPSSAVVFGARADMVSSMMTCKHRNQVPRHGNDSHVFCQWKH